MNIWAFILMINKLWELKLTKCVKMCRKKYGILRKMRRYISLETALLI